MLHPRAPSKTKRTVETKTDPKDMMRGIRFGYDARIVCPPHIRFNLRPLMLPAHRVDHLGAGADWLELGKPVDNLPQGLRDDAVSERVASERLATCGRACPTNHQRGERARKVFGQC